MNQKRLDSIVFHDCMPAMADVMSGERPRPEEFVIGAEPNISGSLLEDRITESLGPQYKFVTYRGDSPQWFTEQSEELRSVMDEDSAILIVGFRYIVAINVDGTRAAVAPLSTSIKSRSDEIWAEAQHILAASDVDVSAKVELRPLSRQLANASYCSYETAKRHMAKAVRRARDPEYVLPPRGGVRENPGGRPGKNS